MLLNIIHIIPITINITDLFSSTGGSAVVELEVAHSVYVAAIFWNCMTMSMSYDVHSEEVVAESHINNCIVLE